MVGRTADRKRQSADGPDATAGSTAAEREDKGELSRVQGPEQKNINQSGSSMEGFGPKTNTQTGDNLSGNDVNVSVLPV